MPFGNQVAGGCLATLPAHGLSDWNPAASDPILLLQGSCRMPLGRGADGKQQCAGCRRSICGTSTRRSRVFPQQAAPGGVVDPGRNDACCRGSAGGSALSGRTVLHGVAARHTAASALAAVCHLSSGFNYWPLPVMGFAGRF